MARARKPIPGRLTAGQDEGDVVLIIDETGDAKTSGDCAGAARQYSGTLGWIAMCQIAVTLTCASLAGDALIGRALYLPADWAADEERRKLAGVPDEVMFATKLQLADGLLQHAHDRGIRAGFIAGDEVYGGLDLRKSTHERGAGYVMAVRSNHTVTLPSGRRLTVKNAASLAKPAMWQRMRTGQAAKGAKEEYVRSTNQVDRVPGNGHTCRAGFSLHVGPRSRVTSAGRGRPRWHDAGLAQLGDGLRGRSEPGDQDWGAAFFAAGRRYRTALTGSGPVMHP